MSYRDVVKMSLAHFNCTQCVFVPSPAPAPVPTPVPVPTPSVGFSTLVWSGGDQSSSSGGPPAFQVSKADYIALASALPSSASSFFPSVWNYITANPPSSSDPHKYLLSIGGSGASANMWTNMVNSPMSDWVTGFSKLYTQNNVYGIDWDLENLPSDASGLVNFCATLGKELKGLYPDYKTGFTLMASYLSPSEVDYQVAQAVSKLSPSLVSYVTAMLYSNTMFTLSGVSESDGVSWSGYLYYGSSNSSCGGNAFPSTGVTIHDMFKNSGIPVFAGLIVSGTYPCGSDCIGALDYFRQQHIIQGIAIWCYGAYASECPCDSGGCKTLPVMDQIIAHFQTGSAPPTDAVINTALGTNNLPWKGYNGFGCTL